MGLGVDACVAGAEHCGGREHSMGASRTVGLSAHDLHHPPSPPNSTSSPAAEELAALCRDSKGRNFLTANESTNLGERVWLQG